MTECRSLRCAASEAYIALSTLIHLAGDGRKQARVPEVSNRLRFIIAAFL